MYKRQTLYRLEGDKLRLPFTALKGLGTAAAASLAEAGRKGPYLSIDDITARSGVSKTVIDLLREHGSVSYTHLDVYKRQSTMNTAARIT